MSKLKAVLIVADQESNRILLKHILTGDYLVLEATNIMEAFTLLAREKVDVIVLDGVIIDEFEFLRLKNEKLALKSLPILVITDFNKEVASEKRAALGVTKTLYRPIEPVSLRQYLTKSLLLHNGSGCQVSDKYDTLTGVYTMQTFVHKTNFFLQEKEALPFDIVCISLKRFNILNDLLGVEAGNNLLCFIAEQLYCFLHKQKVLFGRFDNESFVVCAGRSSDVGEKLLKFLAQKLNEQESAIKGSVAVGVYRAERTDLAIEIMAERAHFAAGKDHNNYISTLKIYSEADRIGMLKEQKILSEMHNALKNEEFKVYYQPKFNLTNNILIGAEALVRWEHPTKGIIVPEKFIDIFEKNGCITVLDEYVWEQVCIFIRKTIDNGLKTVPISVNISRLDIYKEGLCARLCALRKKYSIPASLLELEITESVYTESTQQLIAVIRQLKAAGFKIAMDDFGKGYSSLNMLNEVAVDVLKLDMKFMENADLGKSKSNSNMFSFVVNLATWFDLPIIAEGIETETQVSFLRSLGCNMGQGYLLSKPQKGDDFASTLNNYRGTFSEKKIREPKNNIIIEEFCRHNSMASNIFNVFVGALALLEEQGKRLSIIRANDRFNCIFGQEKLELKFKHKNVLEGIHKADLKGFIAMTRAAKISEQEVAFDSRWYTMKSGKMVWLHSNMRAIYHDSKKTFYLCSIEDMTERKEEEIKNKINGRRLQMVLAESKINVWEFDIASQKFVLNKAAMRPFGLGGEVINIQDKALARKIIHPEDEKKVEAFYTRVSVGKLAPPLVVRVKPNHEKKYIWLQFKYGIVKNDAGEPIRAVGVVVDVSKQKEMEAKYNQEISYKSNEIKRCKYFYEVDLTMDKIIYTSCEPVNSHWNIDNVHFSEIAMKVIKKRVHPVFQKDLMAFVASREMIKLYESGTTEVYKEYLRTDNEHSGSQWYKNRYSFARNPLNGHIMLFIVVKNIHAEKLAEVKIKYAAEHDALTGAYNRGALSRLAKDKLERLGDDKYTAFVIFDLDKFKEVNDTYGHQKGDQVLCTLVKTIHRVFRREDCVCRLGGDEFAVLLEGMGDEALLLKKAKEICKSIANEHFH
ncbi:MAG: EAL domain-containing protein, partial [Acidaminococcaceae bacterium]|nr:EAL domain-containing protein [Acidaminococcaceae bacterium]